MALKENASERQPLPEGGMSNVAALAQLEQVTGIARATLLASIPELARTNLVFGLRWPSDSYHCDDSEVGRKNAEVVKDFLCVFIPAMDVLGDRKNDMSDIDRSFHINIETGEIRGFKDFHGAGDDLSKTHAIHRLSLDELRREMRNIYIGIAGK